MKPDNNLPTGVRHIVLVFASSLAVITYIDRVCIAQAAPYIREDLGLGPAQMGWVFAVFSIAYGLFEIPGGWLGDRFGPRGVLRRVVLFWSFFTMATGWTWNLFSILVCRFCFGAGEAGCFPNITKAFMIWLPSSERSRAQGILWLSARWGGAFTPLLVGFVLIYVNWRVAFFIFGVIGFIWAWFFSKWFRDRPKDNPSVNAAELALLKESEISAPSQVRLPIKLFVRSISVWLLCLQYFCMGYGFYFYISWLPTYLKDVQGASMELGAVSAGLPLFFGGIGSMFGAWLIKRLEVRNLSPIYVRRGLAVMGLVTAGSLLFLVQRSNNVLEIGIIFAAACFFSDFAMPCSWGACMSMGGRFAGSLSGAMNTVGCMGGASVSLVIGYLLALGTRDMESTATSQNWDLVFNITAAVYFTGALAWLIIDPVTPIEKSES